MARRILAACLLGVLVLSGCGGSSEEEPKETASPSPTATTPAVPELPEAARGNTDDAAAAFARYYIAVLNQAQGEDGSTQPLRDASLTTCRTCTRVIERIDQLHETGAKISGGLWTIQRIEMSRPTNLPAGTDPTAVATLDISAAEQTVKEPNKEATTYPAGQIKYALTMAWDGSAWKVAAWDDL